MGQMSAPSPGGPFCDHRQSSLGDGLHSAVTTLPADPPDRQLPAATPEMILHLVRHGQSTWNAEGRLQGQTMDVPLTELGLAQARDAAGTLAHTTLTAILTSDQLRARQTAELLAKPHGLVPEATPLLREQALGELEGRLTRELTPEPVPVGLDIAEVAWGGGESLADVYRRLQCLLAELGARFDPHEQVMLVSHGDTLRVLVALLEGRTHREVDWTPITNCAVITREHHC